MALDINLRNTLKAVVNEVKTFISGTYLSKSNNLSDVSNRQTALNTLLGADTTKAGSIPYVDATGNIILTNRYESGAGMVANEVSIHDHRNSLVGPSGDVYVPMMYFIHRNSMDKFELEFSVFSVDNQSLPTYYGRYVFNRSNVVGMRFYCLDWVCSNNAQMDYDDILAVDSGSIAHDGTQYNTTTIYRKRSNTPDFAAYCIHSMSTYSYDWSRGYVIPTYYTGKYDNVPLKDGERVLMVSDLKSLSDLTNPVVPIYQQAARVGHGLNSVEESSGFAIGESSHAEGLNDVYYTLELTYSSTNTYTCEYNYSHILKCYALYDGQYYKITSAQYDDNNDITTLEFDSLNVNDTITVDISTGAHGDYSHAEGYNATASGDYSHAEGDNTKASGEDSHAEGYETTASGFSSHAEGYNATASGDNSHAEGYGTTASSESSHAEGSYTIASGYYSHAEGDNTTASGEDSHAEGSYTIASGEFSHAEGSNAIASGSSSHAEGESTIAASGSQHVFGKYNVEDNYRTGIPTWVSGTSYQVGDKVIYEDNLYQCKTANKDSSFNYSKWDYKWNLGTYVEIVGNGNRDDARSNARTLDWDGNEILKGNLTIGNALNTGTSTLTGANSLTITNTQGSYQGSIQNLNIISKSRSVLNILSGGTSGTTSTINISTWSDDPTNVSNMDSGSGGGMNIYTEKLKLFNQTSPTQGLFINTFGHLQSSGNSFTIENTGEGQTATNLYLIAQPGEGATGPGTAYLQGKGNPNSGAGGSVYVEATGSGSGGGGYLNLTASGSQDTATSGSGGTVNITANGAGNAGGGTINITSYAAQNGTGRSGGAIYISAQSGTSDSSISIAADTITLAGAVKQLKKAISTSSCTPDTYYCPTAAIAALVCDDTGFTGDYNYTFSGCFTAAAGMTQMPTQTDYQSITMTWYGDIGIETGERYMFCSTKVSATEYVGVVTKLV